MFCPRCLKRFPSDSASCDECGGQLEPPRINGRLAARYISITIVILVSSLIALSSLMQIIFPKPVPHLESEADPIAQATAVRYWKPEIGMNMKTFDEVCKPGELQPGDDIGTYENADHNVLVYQRAYTSARGSNMCFGMFTFDNGKLSAISR